MSASEISVSISARRPDGYPIAVLTPPGMSAVVMLELDHEKVLGEAAVASKMVPVETRHIVR
jgi:hypothetical protein